MKDVFKNARALVNEVNNIADIAKIILFSKPYNNFNLDESLWWLVSTNKQSTFEYGKLFFEVRGDDMFCGYHIEKGVNTTDDLYPQSNQLDKDWLWNEFMASLRDNDEKLVSAITQLASKELKSHLVVSAGLAPTDLESNSDSEEYFLEQKSKFEPSRIDFEIDGSLRLDYQADKTKLNNSQEKIAVYFRTKFQDEKNISNLASKISDGSMPEFDWLWIDVYFGVYVPINKNEITAVDLWRDYLRQWEPWLRKHEN